MYISGGAVLILQSEGFGGRGDTSTKYNAESMEMKALVTDKI